MSLSFLLLRCSYHSLLAPDMIAVHGKKCSLLPFFSIAVSVPEEETAWDREVLACQYLEVDLPQDTGVAVASVVAWMELLGSWDV